jgi:hypothetical protein
MLLLEDGMFRPVQLARFVALAIAVSPLLSTVGAQAPTVQITPNEAGRRVDITIDGKPFTSYIYPTTLRKPTLWPIQTAKGATITRGFPPKQGERVDHPHHVGLWFNHGDVNGFDFWNNSEAIKPDQAKKYGTIVHRKLGQVQSGAGQGSLTPMDGSWRWCHGPSGNDELICGDGTR